MLIRIKDKTIQVQYVDEDTSQHYGLMNQEYLPKNSGMFFNFSIPDIHSFHTRNVKFPLDIIFIDSTNTIIKIYTALPEEDEISSEKKVISVLEVNGGWCDRNGIKVGDKIQLIKKAYLDILPKIATTMVKTAQKDYLVILEKMMGPVHFKNFQNLYGRNLTIAQKQIQARNTIKTYLKKINDLKSEYESKLQLSSELQDLKQKRKNIELVDQFADIDFDIEMTYDSLKETNQRIKEKKQELFKKLDRTFLEQQIGLI